MTDHEPGRCCGCAPIRESKVLEITDEYIVLEGAGEIPRRSAWRRSERR